MRQWRSHASATLVVVAVMSCGRGLHGDRAPAKARILTEDCVEVERLMSHPMGDALRWRPVALHIGPPDSRDQASEYRAWRARLLEARVEAPQEKKALAQLAADAAALASAHEDYADAVERCDPNHFGMARNELELRYTLGQTHALETLELCRLPSREDEEGIREAFLTAAVGVCWCYSYVVQSRGALGGQVTAEVDVASGATREVRFIDPPPPPRASKEPFLEEMLGPPTEPARLPTLRNAALLDCLRGTLEEIEFPSELGAFTVRRHFTFGGHASHAVVDDWIDCSPRVEDDYRRDQFTDPNWTLP